MTILIHHFETYFLFLFSGSWHRARFDDIGFSAACGDPTDEPTTIRYGCQWRVPMRDEFLLDPQTAAVQNVPGDGIQYLQKQFLVEFFVAMDGPNWYRNEGWVDLESPETMINPCWDFFFGVTCDRHNMIIALDLADNKFEKPRR
jgi:hypothetical protein